MVKIKELEEYFEEDFDTILKNNRIVEIAKNDYIKLGDKGYIKTTIDFAWEDYCEWEKNYWRDKKELEKYLKKIKKDFYKWVKNCTINDLFGDYELQTFQRHFKVLDNGKVYYLNDYI